MRKINQKAQKVLNKLVGMAEENGGHCRIDNTDEAFMPVSVEMLPGKYKTVSVSHYGEQNGDLMRDPEMCFFQGADDCWYPYYIRNDYVGMERFAIEFDDSGEPVRFMKREQYDEAVFAGQWMQNIKEQQGF